jgi:hypothetical protein
MKSKLLLKVFGDGRCLSRSRMENTPTVVNRKIVVRYPTWRTYREFDAGEFNAGLIRNFTPKVPQGSNTTL